MSIMYIIHSPRLLDLPHRPHCARYGTDNTALRRPPSRRRKLRAPRPDNRAALAGSRFFRQPRHGFWPSHRGRGRSGPLRRRYVQKLRPDPDAPARRQAQAEDWLSRTGRALGRHATDASDRSVTSLLIDDIGLSPRRGPSVTPGEAEANYAEIQSSRVATERARLERQQACDRASCQRLNRNEH